MMMINPLIVEIYEMTVGMVQLLEQEQHEVFEKKLDARQLLLDQIKTNPITGEEAPLLLKIYELDQQMNSLLKKDMENTKQQINSIKQKKLVSKRFQPYLKQTNGVFLDKKN